MKGFKPILSLLILFGVWEGISFAQEPELLRASKVHAWASSKLKMRPRLGLPERMDHLPDSIYTKGLAWIGHDTLTDMPIWAAWDPNPTAPQHLRDLFLPLFKEQKIQLDRKAWNGAIDECYRWAAEKPAGWCTMACGALITEKERQKMSDAVPYAYYIVVCRKTSSRIGWKSIGFLLPNVPGSKDGLYAFSRSVNMIEHRSGYNFFKALPAGIAEMVEEMTSYELLSPHVEGNQEFDEDGKDMADYMEGIQDAYEDMRDSRE